MMQRDVKPKTKAMTKLKVKSAESAYAELMEKLTKRVEALEAKMRPNGLG